MEFHIVFDDGEGTAGCWFACDSSGKVNENLPKEAKTNLEYCLTHPEDFKRWNEIKRTEREYTEPAHGTCACGTEVELYDQYYGACQCPKCGRWYNLFGQSLLPPEQWERDPHEEVSIGRESGEVKKLFDYGRQH